MADKGTFVDDYRQAASQLLNASARLVQLGQIFTNLGWGASDFDAVLVNSDISSADLVAAITSVTAVVGTMTTQASALAKLRL
jgi:hypothetical protein